MPDCDAGTQLMYRAKGENRARRVLGCSAELPTSIAGRCSAPRDGRSLYQHEPAIVYVG